MRAVCTIGPTSCTRNTSAPAAMAWLQTAAVPHRRARGRGSASTSPMNRLREGPTSKGNPSARSRRSPPQQGEVVGGGLGETEPRIPEDPLRTHPRRQGPVGGAQQVLAHLGDHIAVGGQGVHRLAVATAVHQHAGAVGGRHHRQQGGIAPAGADIVDPVGPGRQGRFGHRGEKGVDREQGPPAPGGGRAARIRRRPGSTRSISASAPTSGAPGLVLWPPRSSRSAPWRCSSRARCTAASGALKRPPSLKESGVRLRTPITRVRSPQRKPGGAATATA